jgi:guanosine-3',5'-bis(diphosphate) 3'-pyrophosphohydrolase
MADKVHATYDTLNRAIEASGKSYDVALIRRAYEMAKEAHGDQNRASGAPYISHPLAVAVILVEMGMDNESIIASLLHDVVEDTCVSCESIEKQFGKTVASLVEGVTKLGRVPFSSREEEQAENVRKMLLAMAKDIRVMIIKLADRLHNARTFQYLRDDKARYKALETMEIYAPIAHRLGIKTIKEELEDISLRFLDPIAYREIEYQLALLGSERQQVLDDIKRRIEERVHDEHPGAYVEGRIKSIYGIYRKVFLQGRSFEEVFDIYAVRIIVDTVIDCYNILGIIHDMFRPIPNRFKDYISTPKQNMYQSLHTTVFDKEGIPFETQIRTWEMHHTAELGIAAHWKYKAGVQGKDSLEERLAWVRQLIESQQDGDDAEDIIRSIKTDIAPEEVFVFTPKGDVISLPNGATVIDFAYAIHSAVGNRMQAAKVDGRIVPLDTVVKTGNIVEIITTGAQGHGPSRGWLDIVQTSGARSKIRAWFKKERREENVAQGREMVQKEFKRHSLNFSDEEEMEKFILDQTKKQTFTTIEDFYAAVGYGGMSLSKIMPRLRDEYIKLYRRAEPPSPEQLLQKPKKERRASSGVIVEGLDNCLVKFAKCCNPLPGDTIVGFVTRGYGVSIHKADCPNAQPDLDDPENASRWLRAEWASNVKETFKSAIEIIATSREGILAEITTSLNTMHVPVHAFSAREVKNHRSQLNIIMGITDLNQLHFITSQLEKIPGVLSIVRSAV